MSALTNVIGAKIVVGCSSRTRWEQHVTEEEEEEEEEEEGGIATQHAWHTHGSLVRPGKMRMLELF